MEFTKKAPNLKKGLTHFGHRLREHGRRLFAVLLCASMVLSGFPASFFQAFASDGSEEYYYELEREALYEAVCTAISEGTTVDKELDFTGEYAEQYAELFDADGTLYELKDLEVEKDRYRDKVLELRAFVRIEGDIPLDGYYEIEGDESIIFLLTNKSKEETSAVIYIDDLETETIEIVSAASVSRDGGPSSKSAVETVSGGTGAGSGASGDGATAGTSAEGETEAAEDEAEAVEDAEADSEISTDDKEEDASAEEDAEAGQKAGEGEDSENDADTSDKDSDSGSGDDAGSGFDSSFDENSSDSKDTSDGRDSSEGREHSSREDHSDRDDNSNKGEHSDRSDNEHSDSGNGSNDRGFSGGRSSSDNGKNSDSSNSSDSSSRSGSGRGSDSKSNSDSDSDKSDKTASVSSNRVGLLSAALVEELVIEEESNEQGGEDEPTAPIADDSEDLTIIPADEADDIVIALDEGADGIVITTDSDVIITADSEVTIASASDADAEEDSSDNDTSSANTIDGEIYEAVILDAKKAAVAFVTTAEDLGLDKYSHLKDQTIDAKIYEDDSYGFRLADGTSITLTGMMPVDAEVKAYPVELDEFEQSEGVTVLAAYDISIFDANSEKYQPEDGAIDVVIENQLISEALEYEYDLSVYHMEDEGSEPEEIYVSVTENGVEFEAESFSVYAVIIDGDIQFLANETGSLQIFKYTGDTTSYLYAWLPAGEYKLVFHTEGGEYYHFVAYAGVSDYYPGEDDPYYEIYQNGYVYLVFDYETAQAHIDGSPSSMFTFTVEDDGSGGSYVVIKWDDSEHYNIYDFGVVDASRGYYELDNVGSVATSEVTEINTVYEVTESSVVAVEDAKFVLTYIDEHGVTYYAIFDGDINDDGELAKGTTGTFVGWTDNEHEATILVSDAEGFINLEGIPVGEYYLEEIEAPSNYELVTDPILVTVTSEGGSAEVKNEIAGPWHDGGQYRESIFVEKVWDNTGNTGDQPDSVKVHLIDTDTDIVVDSATLSDSNSWKCSFEVIEEYIREYDHYQLEEEYVPYYSTSITVTDSYEEPYGDPIRTFTVTNTYDDSQVPLNEVEIYKYDSETEDKDPLAGAGFIVSRYKTDSVTGEPTDELEYAVLDRYWYLSSWTDDIEEATEVHSDVNGSIIIYLPEGEYTLIETEAPEGYAELEDGITFTVSADGEVTVDEGEEQDDEGTILIGNQYETEESANIKLLKLDEEGNPLGNAEFIIATQEQDESGEEVTQYLKFDSSDDIYEFVDFVDSEDEATTLVTGSDGWINISDIPTENEYILIETNAPYGYIQLIDEVQFSIDEYGRIKLETYDDSVEVRDNTTIVVRNNAIATVDIYKYDSTSGEYDYFSLPAGDYYFGYITDAGTWTYFGSQNKEEGNVDNYNDVIYVVHSFDAANNGTQASNAYEITVAEDGGYIFISEEVYATIGLTGFFLIPTSATGGQYNNRIPTDSAILLDNSFIEKVPGAPLSGASFVVSRTVTETDPGTGTEIEEVEYAQFDENGELTGWTLDSSAATEITSGNDGYIHLILPEGEYTLTEVETPDGYVTQNRSIRFTVDSKGAIVNVGNDPSDSSTPIPETKSITVTKIWEDNADAAGKRPESITINLFEDGIHIDQRTFDGEDNTWTCDFTYLDGDETITYTITEDPVEDYETEIIETDDGYTVTNTYTAALVEVEIYKYDMDSSDLDPLSGAKFIVSRIGTNPNTGEDITEYALFDEATGELSDWTTDQSEATVITSGEDGYIHISLPVGDYSLIETKAPDGYILLSGSINITVIFEAGGSDDPDSTSDPLEVRVGNSRGARLPDTGGTGTLPFQTFGLFLTGSALWLLFLTLRRRRRWVES